MSVELDDQELEPETFEPTVTISISTAVDAVYDLGEGRKIKVKSSQSGVRLSYTKRVKGYYGKAESKTEGVTFPIQFLPELTNLLASVEAKSNK